MLLALFPSRFLSLSLSSSLSLSPPPPFPCFPPTQVICGTGTLVYADGDRYTGTWLEGKMHGRGKYDYANGDKYVK